MSDRPTPPDTDPSLHALESAVLQAIAAQERKHRDGLLAQLKHARVVRRENTGVGFFTSFEVDKDRALPLETSGSPIGDVDAEVAGFQTPMTFQLFLRDGYASTLEGATFGDDDTTDLDFGMVTFTILPWADPSHPG